MGVFIYMDKGVGFIGVIIIFDFVIVWKVGVGFGVGDDVISCYGVVEMW